MRHWFDTVSRSGLRWGASFDIDFHTIPFHGEDPLVEKHYVSKRSRSQKGMLAFLAQDAETRVFCIGSAEMGQTGLLVKLETVIKDCEWIYRFWANPGRPRGGIVPPAPVLAPGSALGSRPRVALSSALVPSV